MLLAIAGPEQGSLFPLGATSLLIGRDGDADIVVGDDAVSCRHARVSNEADAVRVEDLDSRNGTFVNGERVEGRRQLADGDHLRVGNTIFKFSLLEELEERALVSLFDSAVRDPLTHAFNRRHLVSMLKSELAFAARQGTPLAFLLFDIDHFKRVNDTYGHHAGDVVLEVVAATIQRVLRPYDALARFGGEEFVVIARNTDLRNAEILAERVRRRVQELSFYIGGGERSSSKPPTRRSTRPRAQAAIESRSGDVRRMFRRVNNGRTTLRRSLWTFASSG